jgi:urate oxidase
MEHFASGWKRSYYGKGDVIAYRLRRDGATAPGKSAVFGASVLMLVYGETFWPTYTTGDNTGLIATDSMKNFVQRETLNFEGDDLEEYCKFLGDRFLAKYAQVEGIQVSAADIPYAELEGGGGFAPSGPERAYARVELSRHDVVDVASALRGFKLLRLGGSAFTGFVRDEYTTLPELHDRPLHMWLDLEWTYGSSNAAFSRGHTVATVRRIVHDTFRSFESGSIQQVI